MNTLGQMTSLTEHDRLESSLSAAADHAGVSLIQDSAELESIVGQPELRVIEKVHHELHEIDRIWLSQSPLCFIATSDRHSNLDISPRGDPAGFIYVIDAHTIALPERPGNKRADSLHNILENPHISVICIVPGEMTS